MAAQTVGLMMPQLVVYAIPFRVQANRLQQGRSAGIFRQQPRQEEQSITAGDIVGRKEEHCVCSSHACASKCLAEVP